MPKGVAVGTLANWWGPVQPNAGLLAAQVIGFAG